MVKWLSVGLKQAKYKMNYNFLLCQKIRESSKIIGSFKNDRTDNLKDKYGEM